MMVYLCGIIVSNKYVCVLYTLYKWKIFSYYLQPIDAALFTQVLLRIWVMNHINFLQTLGYFIENILNNLQILEYNVFFVWPIWVMPYEVIKLLDAL